MALQGGSHELGEVRRAQVLDRHVWGQPGRRYTLVAPRGQLMARALERPGADIDDQPALLCRRHEILRQAHTAARVLPAQESLETDQLTAAQRVLRLIVERELAP